MNICFTVLFDEGTVLLVTGRGSSVLQDCFAQSMHCCFSSQTHKSSVKLPTCKGLVWCQTKATCLY